jgi:arylsulfatase A-like enzyme
MQTPYSAPLYHSGLHSTSLWSPTRAALVTGRYHHTLDFGLVSEQSSGRSFERPTPSGRVIREGTDENQ